jgi:hypothetical protein
MKIAKVQEMVFIDKPNKWFYTRKFFQVVSHLHVVSIMQVVPQVILNFKWSSNEECIPHLQELKFIKWMTHAMT